MSSAIDRAELAGIRARVVKARKDWRLHRQMCRTCAQLSGDRSQYCGPGWDIRVELHHAERANRNYRNATPVNQGTLF